MAFTDLDAAKGWLAQSRWGHHSYDYIIKNHGKWFEKQQHQIDKYAQRERARLQREEDRKIAEEDTERRLAHDKERDAVIQQNRQADLDIRAKERAEDRSVREQELARQRTISDRQYSYQQKRDAQDDRRFDMQFAAQRQDNLSLLNWKKERAAVEDQRLIDDRAERARERQQTQANFAKTIAEKSRMHDENLAFRKEEAAIYKKEKAKADSLNETSTRNQVLGSIGYGVSSQRATIQSSVEKLLVRAGTGRNNRRLQLA